MSEKQKDETTNVAACPPLSAELGSTVSQLKQLFEEWLPRQVGDHMKKEFANFDDEDGYHDQIINAMWIRFCAGSVLSRGA